MLRPFPSFFSIAAILAGPFSLLFVGCRQERIADQSHSSSVKITVAAASDLTLALKEVGDSIRQHEWIDVVFSFGSSGLLTQQIEAGAPFDAFVSASESYIERLNQAGLVLEGSDSVFAQGRLVLWQRSDAIVRLESPRQLALASIKRFAIANPEHAPYGRAAREVLNEIGIWNAVNDKVVYAENVAQAFQFAKSGNVDVAIIARSLIAAQEGRTVPIDPNLHSPINQTICILKRTQSVTTAQRFVSYLRSPEGNGILKRYGFRLPTESVDVESQ